MIVPVLFQIQTENAGESFVTDYADVWPRTTFERMRIKLLVFNTEDEMLHGFSAQVMFDQAAEPGHELATLYQSHSPAAVAHWGSKEYMRQLRDHLNDLIGSGESE